MIQVALIKRLKLDGPAGVLAGRQVDLLGVEGQNIAVSIGHGGSADVYSLLALHDLACGGVRRYSSTR